MNFNSLLVGLATLAGYGLIRALPALGPLPPRHLPVKFEPVAGPVTDSAFRRVGAWRLVIEDRRVQGLSGLAFADGGLVAVSDLGAAVRSPTPTSGDAHATVVDLRDGPGRFGSKKNRDAEALTTDGRGGWFVAFENHHSVWHYDGQFRGGQEWAQIDRPTWRANVGVEALIPGSTGPVAFAQSGQEILAPEHGKWRGVPVSLGWQVADAARAPDGSTWLLLRSMTFGGFDEAIAPLLREDGQYRLGPVERFPKRAFDNFEGMAIAPVAEGWRFWLVSDDGHYLWPHTILMALDLPRTQENARR